MARDQDSGGTGEGSPGTSGSEPDYRYSLANERTFLAWIRTSLALLAGGIAVVQLVPAFGLRGAREALGVALVTLGLVLAAVSHRRWARNERAMRQGGTLPATKVIALLGYGLAIIALGALAIVLVYLSSGRH